MSASLELESDEYDQTDQSDNSDDSLLVQAQSSKATTSKKKCVVLTKGQLRCSGKHGATKGRIPAMFKSKGKTRPMVTAPAKKRKGLAFEISLHTFLALYLSTITVSQLTPFLHFFYDVEVTDYVDLIQSSDVEIISETGVRRAQCA